MNWAGLWAFGIGYRGGDATKKTGRPAWRTEVKHVGGLQPMTGSRESCMVEIIQIGSAEPWQDATLADGRQPPTSTGQARL